ncbi:MAG: SAM-dependent methyltransferase, partial [Sphingobacterium paramultivorum]
AKIISRFLKPKGKFIFVEFHPVVWMFDDNFDKIGYNYFNIAPIVETEEGTYADKDAAISQSYVTWNHSMSEVVGALLHNGLNIQDLNEFDYSPYPIFKT